MKIGDQVLYKGRKGLLCDIVQWHTGKRYFVYMPHLSAVQHASLDDLKLSRQKGKLGRFSVDTSGDIDINDLSEIEAKKLLVHYIEKFLNLEDFFGSIKKKVSDKLNDPKWLEPIRERVIKETVSKFSRSK